MKKILAAPALAITLLLGLSACGDSDDDTIAIATTHIDAATAFSLDLGGFNHTDHSFDFALTTADGTPVIGASQADYKVIYIGKNQANVSAFSLPWHKAVLCSNAAHAKASCTGKLIETEPGKYQFTPDSKPTSSWQQTRLAVTVVGALAQNKPQVTDIDQPAGI